ALAGPARSPVHRGGSFNGAGGRWALSKGRSRGMVFPSWNIWRRRRGQKPAGRPAFKPAVEALEQRWVPSTITKVQDLGAHAQALGNASSLTLTVPNAGVAAGHSIVVEVAVDQAAGTAQVSDSAGN